MMREANEVEQAVARTLRNSLETLQRSSDELHQCVSDLVSACASTRPANSLPPMIRAQTVAASLAASLEVLARFVTAALQPELRSAAEQSILPDRRAQPITELAPHSTMGTAPALKRDKPPLISEAPMEAQPAQTPAQTLDERRASDMVEVDAAAQSAQELESAEVISEAVMESQPAETLEERRESDMMEEGAPVAPTAAPAGTPPVMEYSDAGSGSETASGLEAPLGDPAAPAPPAFNEFPPAAEAFDISKLPSDQQELHRRANRVAKVSMQDIRMLRPNDVKSGKEHKDLCHRLRDDIERAHKEYDRRFQAILGHPVDYFYDWMVEILADGDPGALGEYPYPSPVLRH
jgi:hypothetical protein